VLGDFGGSDCGFSSQMAFTPEIHPTVIWARRISSFKREPT
jgi:hypothetical protein